jgi:6-O-methylguanine DNA methyltransferase, DNA binding domain
LRVNAFSPGELMKSATTRTTKTSKMAPSSGAAKATDWRKRFAAKKEPKVVVLETDFAGVKAGNKLYIATPGIIANYVASIPYGETRTIERLRNELARKHKAHATCPVSTAIFLRVVAEAAWDDLTEGALPQNVVPFWRVIDANSPIAKRLRCDSAWLTHMRAAEAVA